MKLFAIDVTLRGQLEVQAESKEQALKLARKAIKDFGKEEFELSTQELSEDVLLGDSFFIEKLYPSRIVLDGEVD